MIECRKTAVIGAGVIGASWAALFLASGRDVAVFDPSKDTENAVLRYVDRAWSTLLELGSAVPERKGDLKFYSTAAEAVRDADFVQESAPERIVEKHALYAEIEPALRPEAIIASSASGLTLSEMQLGWNNPGRFVLGHPFNPPHLIPLVEVMGNGRTLIGIVETAERFYKSLGKVTIRINREVPGHVANRLQAALWREAIHLIRSGVASVEDVDTAVWAGPGLRWAAMGPTMLFHLGAGDGGLATFCERYADSFNRWWDDLGELHLDPTISAQLVEGVSLTTGTVSPDEWSQKRDALITAMQKATATLRTVRSGGRV